MYGGGLEVLIPLIVIGIILIVVVMPIVALVKTLREHLCPCPTEPRPGLQQPEPRREPDQDDHSRGDP